MNKNWSLPVACIVCVLSLCAMVLALINNGKQEQDGSGHGGAHAFFDEGEDFRRSKAAEQGNDNGECHENGDGIHFGGDQTVDHQSDQDKTSNT